MTDHDAPVGEASDGGMVSVFCPPGVECLYRDELIRRAKSAEATLQAVESALLEALGEPDLIRKIFRVAHGRYTAQESASADAATWSPDV